MVESQGSCWASFFKHRQCLKSQVQDVAGVTADYLLCDFGPVSHPLWASAFFICKAMELSSYRNRENMNRGGTQKI